MLENLKSPEVRKFETTREFGNIETFPHLLVAKSTLENSKRSLLSSDDSVHKHRRVINHNLRARSKQYRWHYDSIRVIITCTDPSTVYTAINHFFSPRYLFAFLVAGEWNKNFSTAIIFDWYLQTTLSLTISYCHYSVPIIHYSEWSEQRFLLGKKKRSVASLIFLDRSSQLPISSLLCFNRSQVVSSCNWSSLSPLWFYRILT